jgi:hypothetical protein
MGERWYTMDDSLARQGFTHCPGYALATVFVNGIPSVSRIIPI